MANASPAALAYGEHVARKLLTNRAGHGGNPAHGVGYRQMRAADLTALAAIAFDAGRASAKQEAGIMDAAQIDREREAAGWTRCGACRGRGRWKWQSETLEGVNECATCEGIGWLDPRNEPEQAK